jgi:hypothetical protein
MCLCLWGSILRVCVCARVHGVYTRRGARAGLAAILSLQPSVGGVTPRAEDD